MHISYSSLDQAIAALKVSIDSLREAVFDLADPTDFKIAENLYRSKIERIPGLIKENYGRGALEPFLQLARGWLVELEKTLAGQQSLFAAVITPGVGKVAVLDSSQKETFDDIYSILESIPDVIERETQPRPLDGIRPPRRTPGQPTPKRKPKPSKTYNEAKADILSELKKAGWTVVDHLKIPHATHRDGKFRLWFKSQAIYMSRGDDTKDMGKAMSLYNMFPDLRFVDPAAFVHKIHQFYKL